MSPCLTLRMLGSRPVIKENTAHVIAAHQIKDLLLWCDSKLHTIILWHVISVKLNIGQKIPGLEITTLNL